MISSGVSTLELENILSETKSYGMPRIYNLQKDPGEGHNVLFPETWVTKSALGHLGAHIGSLRANPPIKGVLKTHTHRLKNNKVSWLRLQSVFYDKI